MLQIKNALGGGKPEGLYVWKKYERIPEQTIVNPTFHIKANVSTQKAIITSDNINFKAFGTLTDSNNFYQSREPEFCNFMNGFKNSNSSVKFSISTSTYSGQLQIDYLSSTYWNAFTKMTPTDTGAELTAANLFQTTIDETLQYTGTKTIAAKIGEFISYVVSDKETAYPDGGEKDGYWYERVSEGLTPEMLGFTKYEVGSFTLSSNNSTITFNHTLGEKPKAVIVNEDSSITDLKYVNTYLTTGMYSAYSYNKRAAEYGTYNNTSNKTTVEITTGNTTRNFKAGVKYNYVVFA